MTPDDLSSAEMNEKRLAVEAKMEARQREAEARRAAKIESDEGAGKVEMNAYEKSFGTLAEVVNAQLETLRALSNSADEVLASVADSIVKLHALVSGATSFLPLAIRESSLSRISEFEASLKTERERLMPRKKFSFKNRGKVTAVQDVAGGVSETLAARCPPPDALTAKREDTFAAPTGCQGFRSKQDETLVREAGHDGSSDFALEHLIRCHVQLLSHCTALWIRGLRNTTLFALPVNGSIYVTDCEDCVLYVGSRQLRIHTSQAVDFYVHTSSHPIIENCSALRFAPYPTLPTAYCAAIEAAGLKLENNQWDQVDDFNWLKAHHSPNWSIMTNEDRQIPLCLQNIQ